MPIRARIALFGTGVVASTLFLFGVLLFSLAAVSAIRQQDTALKTRGEQAVSALQTAPAPDLQPRPALAPANLRTSVETFVELLDPEGTPISGGAVVDGRLPSFDAAALATATPTGFAFVTTTIAPGVQVRAYVRRWSRPDLGLFGYYVVAGQPTRSTSSQRRGLATLLLLSGLLTLVVALTATWWVSGRSLRPLKLMALTADTIGATGDLGRRLPEIKPNDEIGQLSRSFNGMLSRLQDASVRLEEAYRRVADALDLQKRFVADASHELRTPLTTIRSNAGFLLSGHEIQPQDRDAALQDISAEAERMSRLVQDLLTLARADAGQHLERSPLDLADLLATVVRQAARTHTDRTVSIDHTKSIVVAADAGALTQLLWILIDNAVKHTQRGGAIALSLHRSDSAVVVEVSDDGDGIPPEALERVFERFYQANGARSGGAGLGLSIAAWIVAEHGGTIAARNNPIAGATLTVTLPAQ
ncbi:MAG: sensor histidine kinase [Dehalococcoidia bacterium]